MSNIWTWDSDLAHQLQHRKALGPHIMTCFLLNFRFRALGDLSGVSGSWRWTKPWQKAPLTVRGRCPASRVLSNPERISLATEDTWQSVLIVTLLLFCVWKQIPVTMQLLVWVMMLWFKALSPRRWVLGSRSGSGNPVGGSARLGLWAAVACWDVTWPTPDFVSQTGTGETSPGRVLTAGVCLCWIVTEMQENKRR